MKRMTEEFNGRCLLNNAASVHHCYVITCFRNNTKIMRY
tara:strand:- start:1 stop:117 length:117 start_codon:yes stop_codon:yes gene_type:complete